MMKHLLILVSMLVVVPLHAQETVKPRPLTLDEYKKAKTFEVKDLDADTYVKFESVYILDRYEMRKPYFVTGDDGLKKRFDLYRLLVKPEMDPLGMMIYYTNESGKRYSALLPNFTAAPEVWENYFEDIHAIDKQEENFVLKLSYVLSKELGFQLYRSLNAGKDLSKESATYGNNICFPGDQWVTLASGEKKVMEKVQPGDAIVLMGDHGQPVISKVTTKTMHEPKNYALTEVLLIAAQQVSPENVILSVRRIRATPNHPIETADGFTKVGALKEGDVISCPAVNSQTLLDFEVWSLHEMTDGSQPVYSVECEAGADLLVNEVPVKQK